MHNRIKRLEALVAGASELIARLKEENEVLKKQVELLGAARSKAGANSAAARELADFKAKVRRRLERICARIDKANDLQPGLFGEDDEQ
jgi:predicted  nucleic acid-binding Zn-ribbon protein